MSLISSDICKTTYERVSCNLEYKTCERLACIWLYLDFIASLRISSLDSSDVDRLRQITDNGIEKELNALILV